MIYKFKEKNSSIIIFCWLICLFFSLEALSQEANPLPFVANWNTGALVSSEWIGYQPKWQVENIEKGHHILLSFKYDVQCPDWRTQGYVFEYYNKDPLAKASE